MIERQASVLLKRISKSFRVLLVTGPRQVGKTTLLKKYLPDGMEYVTLDDEILRERAKSDPRGFLEEHPWPLMIDEVQYAPELFPYIKMRVDSEGKRGMYWLTGSQQFKLMKNVEESLAGRVGIVEMNSLSYAELTNRGSKIGAFNPQDFDSYTADKIEVNELFEKIFQGGMPELNYIEEIEKSDFFKAYLNTYISRDVEGIVNIQNSQNFLRFMRALASYNGERLNYSNIANTVHISDKTVRSWVDVLVTSGVVYLLEPYYHTNLGKISHMPKLFFMDQGLASYLEGWQSARELQMSTRAGQYFEAFVVSEIIKTYAAMGLEPRLNYYRDENNAEIDLILEQNGKLYPFEIKKTATPKSDMIKAFGAFREYVPNVAGGGLICLYDSLLHLNESDQVIPVEQVLLVPTTRRG